VKPNEALKLKAKEIRDKTAAELGKMVDELSEEIFRLRFRKGAGQLKQTSNIRLARRSLARVKTVLRERELSQSKGGE
jgi:large subunit ribosomal protein L29